VYVFNTFYFNFVDDISSVVEQQLQDKLKVISEAKEKRSKSTTRYIERLVSQFSRELYDECANQSDILNADKIDEIRVVKKITVKEIKDASAKADTAQLKSYLYIFVLLGYLYSKTIREESSSSSDDDDGASSDDDTHSDDIIEKSLAAFKDIQAGKSFSEKDIDEPIVSALLTHIASVLTPDLKKKSQDDMDFKNPAEVLKNTKIGSLAKEISDEIDLSSLKIDKPEDLLNPSNLGNNNVLTNIISKVGNKIHEKIDRGEIKHEELMSEAINMLGMLGKSGDPMAGSFLNNPLFKDVMKNMGNLSGLANMAKNSDKTKSASVRDRLRKKLEDKEKSQSRIL